MSMNHLPDEIILSIIDDATYTTSSIELKDKPFRRYDDLTSVSRVCRSWRALLVDCGALWNEIYMRQGPPSDWDRLMEVCLRRSGEVPLDVYLIISTVTSQFLPAQVFAQMDRIWTLRLMVTDLELFKRYSGVLKQPMDILYHLAIKTCHPKARTMTINLENESPSLRKLTLFGVKILSRPPHMLRAVTTLKLYRIERFGSQSTFEGILAMLRECPNLQVLTLTMVDRESDHADIRNPLARVPLNNLHQLKIGLTTWASQLLMCHLSLPSLDTLIFNRVSSSPCTIEYLTASKNIPAGPLEALDLVMASEVAIHVKFKEGSTHTSFTLLYTKLRPSFNTTVVNAITNVWNLSTLTMLTLTLPQVVHTSYMPLYLHLFQECERVTLIRLDVRPCEGHNPENLHGTMTLAFFVTLAFYGPLNPQAGSSALPQFPFPGLTDIELTGAPFITNKTELDAFVILLRERGVYGHKVQRLMTRGQWARLPDEFVSELKPFVEVIQTA